jgi:actin-like ATPase involved in cell morphogenesis
VAGCGIDFGTTNSLVGCIIGGKASLLTDELGRPHPSVIWYHTEQVKAGREARQMLDSNTIGITGDFLRSPKSLLGKGQPSHVGGRIVWPVDAAGEIFKHLLRDAQRRRLTGMDFSRAVVTIPVDMRGSGRRELREAARSAGISIEHFVHEPFAALYGYARRQSDPAQVLDRIQNRLALVFDWGGGTLDLTLCERVGDMLVQVQSLGRSDIGGDVFDERLEHLVVSRHMQRYGWAQRREIVPGQKARLLGSCEQAKITLSNHPSASVVVRGLFVAAAGEADLAVEVTQAELAEVTRDLLDAGLTAIEDLLRSTGQTIQAVEMCLPTGGVVAMPAVKDRLLRLFGPSRCEFTDRADTLIAEGAAWIASCDVPIKLAKNIEFRHANQTWVPVLKAGRDLPRGSDSSDPVHMTLYCADPRDGIANIELARPKRSGRVQAADARHSYELLQVEINQNASPLRESVELSLTIDPDLIVHVSATGCATGREARTEIHELEFGVGLGNGSSRTVSSTSAAGQPAALRDEVKVLVADFVDAQQRTYPSPWVPLDDPLVIDDRQETLRDAVRRLCVDIEARVPDSVITLLQEFGFPCVTRAGRWLVSNATETSAPIAPEAAPFGPAGSVLARSNVTQRHDHLEMIPGDIVDDHHPGFTGSPRVTPRQRDELRWRGSVRRRSKR